MRKTEMFIKGFLNGNINSWFGRLIRDGLVRSGVLLLSIILAYNSYKGYLRTVGLYPESPQELKTYIKSTFPWAVLIFASIHIAYGLFIRLEGKKTHFNFRRDTIFLILYAAAINLVFYSKGFHVFLVQNLAILYCAIFLALWAFRHNGKVVSSLAAFESWVIHKKNHDFLSLRERLSKRIPESFFAGFFVFIVISAIGMAFGKQKLAEKLGNMAYFLAAVGIGLKLVQSFKVGKGNEKED